VQLLVCYITYKKYLQNGLSVNRFSHNYLTRKQTLSYRNGLFSHNVVCIINKNGPYLRVKAIDEIQSSHINAKQIDSPHTNSCTYEVLENESWPSNHFDRTEDKTTALEAPVARV
jgi:hypothetical protein